MWWCRVLKVCPVEAREELVAHQLWVTKARPGGLEQSLHHRLEMLGRVLGEVDRHLGVAHDVGVGVDHRSLQVGEGRRPVEHFVDEDSQTPIVAFYSMALLAGLEALQNLRCNIVGGSHWHHLEAAKLHSCDLFDEEIIPC